MNQLDVTVPAKAPDREMHIDRKLRECFQGLPKGT